MNSEKMKVNFEEEYTNFFKRNLKIFSLPLLIHWASDISSEYKGIHIKQKIPLRIYLGINKIQNKTIKFNKIKYFDINEDLFIEEKLKEYSPVINEINESFNKEYNKKENINYGLEFNILAESGKGQGMGFISILGTLLIIGYKSFNNKLYQDIKLDSTSHIMNIINKENIYNDILKTTVKLNKILSRELSLSGQLTSLFDGQYPTVSFVQHNYREKKENKIKFFGYKMNHIEKGLPSIPYIPIDFGLIYTGMPVSVSQILYSNKYTKTKENNIIKNLKNFFYNDIKDLKDEDKPIFYHDFCNKINPNHNVFIENYQKLMGILSFKIFNNLIEFYTKPFEEYLAKKFLKNVNKITRFNLLTKKYSNHYRDFIFEAMYLNKKFNINFSIAPNDTMLMGGNAIFAMMYEGSRGKLLKALKYEKEKNSGIKLVYANWLDGIEKKGLIIEQDIEKKIYSNFISKNFLLLINNNGEKRIIDENFFENNETKKGLFLDLTKNKIFFNGNKLTSKELKSQNTTIEVLMKLLENKGEFISNKILSTSSYSSNKNEMYSKIISPLKKLIKKECNIDLQISITGNISDFKIKLDINNKVDINIIKYLL